MEKKYAQHKGKQIAEQIKWEAEYEDEVKNFNLMEWLFKQKQETK